MGVEDRWSDAIWPRICSQLPDAPGPVLEIGCGPAGGVVPKMHERGYTAVGVDPEAPEGSSYRRARFEELGASELPGPFAAVVASRSLHHVADPARVLDRVAAELVPGGTVIVVEWARERFDEATARWCFERLDPARPEDWLHRHRDAWMASGQSFETYLAAWAESEGLHPGEAVVAALDRRFERISFDRGAYFFADLAATSEADELAAVGAGQICAARIDYAGRRP